MSNLTNEEWYDKMDALYLNPNFLEGYDYMIKLAAPVEKGNIGNGEGVRMVIWNQGCPLRCPGCHNPETQTQHAGRYLRVKAVENIIKKEAHRHQGITLSGGDPFLQPHANRKIADFAHSVGLDVWAYSGRTFENLRDNEETRLLLEGCDVLVDGPFILAQRDVTLAFRGSANQRIIDVQKSLQTGGIVLYGQYS